MSVEVWIREVVARDATRDRNLEVMMRDRSPCLLAVARRLLLDEPEAREIVDLASTVARDLLPVFRASSRGDWLQGLVVGLAVARAAQRRHT
jgi:hypothetical protein